MQAFYAKLYARLCPFCRKARGILRPVSFEYPWGAALAEIRSAAPVIYV
jgi:hypothetical protein